MDMRKNQNRKLSLEQVGRIKELFAEGYTQGSIGKHFGVTAQTVGRIVRGESWTKESRSVLPSRAEQDAVGERLLRLQEELDRGEGKEEMPVLPPTRAIPPSPLDGGDAPSEGDGSGLSAVQERARAYGLDVDKLLKGDA